jgi:hypothetical protein
MLSQNPTQRSRDAIQKAAVKLVYLSSLNGGITRKPGKPAFLYYDADGRRIEDRGELDRIAALAIPPAYTDVLISVDPNSHLQATGRDARGRKQYRYHPEWSAERGKSKFAQLPDLPRGCRGSARRSIVICACGSRAWKRPWRRSSGCWTISISASATPHMPRKTVPMV